ncbi:MAG: DUF5808 domain-containing protein [Propionibacteriaceae bacterium]|jgi:uncharacterized membrane protein|nr:DUF5808 domain-containing protein [Propionibacteriaceae bacterium]
MMLAVLLIVDVLLIASCAFTPYVTRKTELFGVTLPSAHTNDPELALMRAGYRNQLLASGVALIAASLALGLYLDWKSALAPILWVGLVFAYLIAAFVLYLPKHRQMKRIKQSKNWDTDADAAVIVVDTTPATQDVVSPAWLLLFPLIWALTVLGILVVWPNVPEQVPVHFDVNGVADVYQPKGFGAVAPLLIVQVFLAAVISGTYFLIRASKRQIDAANPDTSRLQSIRFRRVTTGFEIAVGVVVSLAIGAMQIVTLHGAENPWVIMTPIFAMLAIVLGGTYFLMFRVGQGGSRLPEPRGANSRNANVNDDRFWKLGQFYFNPDDPALFVEKRFGVGYTVNLARPTTWVLLGGLLVLIAALIVTTFWLTG